MVFGDERQDSAHVDVESVDVDDEVMLKKFFKL